MVGFGFWMLLIFGLAFFFSATRSAYHKRWLQWLALFSLPLPWLSSELGWFVAEFGRQPWTVSGMLPTYLSVSSISVGEVVFSLIGFTLLYGALLVVEMYLMIKYVRLGPSSLGTGRYYHERGTSGAGLGGGHVIAAQPQQKMDSGV